MVTVRNAHGSETLFGKTRPDGVVVTVKQIGTSVAQMGQKFSTGIGSGFDLFVVGHVVSDGNVDAHFTGAGDGFRSILSISTDGDDLDESVCIQLVNSLF